MGALDDVVGRLPPRARAGLLWLLVALGYVVARRLSSHWVLEGPAVLAWPGLGITYSAAVLGGPVLATATAVAAFADAVARGTSPDVAAGFSGGIYAASLAAIVVTRAGRADEFGEELRGFIVRVASAVAAALVVSASTVATLAATGRLPGGALHHAGFWLLGDLTGILVVSPFLRSWIRRTSLGVARLPEIVAVFAVAAVLAELVSGGAIGRLGPAAYLLLPVVFWAALRAGRRGTSTVVLIVAAISVANTAAGAGPFVTASDPTQTGISLSTFLLVLSLSGLGFASLGSARDSAEERLRASEQRFRALTENATDLVTVLAPDGRILYDSPSSAAVLGWSPEELTGLDVFEHVHPEDVERCRAAFARVVAGAGEPVVAPLRYRHRDGHWVHVVSTGRNLLHDPAVGGIVVNSRDVSESVHAEHERQQAERRYRDLVEQLPLVSYVNDVTTDAPPLYVSPQIEELLGYPVQCWYAEPHFADRVIHTDDAARMEELFVVGRREGSVQAEYRMTAADGGVVWVLDRMVTLRDETGRPTAVQGFLVDITRQKLLEEQLRRAQRMEELGLLAGGVAHDFNNLLTAISGYTRLALAHIDDPARCRSDLAEVEAAADRAADLTRRLLAFGRRQVLEHEVVDLNEIVVETRQLLVPLIGEGIRVVTALEPGLGAVRADPGQLGQVIVNLVVNARDAMTGGGTITISTANARIDGAGGPAEPGDYVRLSVTDTGWGIDPAAAEHLFDPFFTTKGVGRGTGLGLAMVYGIVEQSGGTVLVESEPGHGAEFRVLLPRSYETPRAVRREPGRAAGGSETVLLVEDDDVVRRLTAEMLERQGYRVLVAAGPSEALAVEEPWDVLLTDVVMPGMSGPELAERLRERLPGARVLFVSGYSGQAVAREGGLGGELLEKPFTAEELARKVRTVLEETRVAPAA
jgi:PAS domain S-box-containing protein